MDDAAAIQGVEGDFGHAQPSAQVPRRLTHALRVPLGQRILRLNRCRQREDHLLSAVERVVERLQAERRPDAGDQLHAFDRLGHEVVGAGFQSAHPILGLIEGGDHDHRQQPAARTRLYPAADLIAVHARHLDVEKDEVGRLCPYLLERGFAVLGKADLAIQAGQVCLDQLSIGCSVVNYQYDRHPQAASHPLLSDSRTRNCNLGPLS